MKKPLRFQDNQRGNAERAQTPYDWTQPLKNPSSLFSWRKASLLSEPRSPNFLRGGKQGPQSCLHAWKRPQPQQGSWNSQAPAAYLS